MTPGGAQERIVQEIEWKRRELGTNFRELEQKVRDATDWRAWVRRNPMLMIGVGLGAGLVLSRMFVAGVAPAVRGSMSRRNDSDTRESGRRERSASTSTMAGLAVRGAARLLAVVIPAVREYNRARPPKLVEPPPLPQR
jgi:hypothetical protein